MVQRPVNSLAGECRLGDDAHKEPRAGKPRCALKSTDVPMASLPQGQKGARLIKDSGSRRSPELVERMRTIMCGISKMRPFERDAMRRFGAGPRGYERSQMLS